MLENSKEGNKSIESVHFPYVNLSKILAILGCSKPFLYGLIKNEIITPYYFTLNDNKEGKGKPYFNLIEISHKLKEGRIKSSD
jgi:hypothetical protein